MIILSKLSVGLLPDSGDGMATELALPIFQVHLGKGIAYAADDQLLALGAVGILPWIPRNITHIDILQPQIHSLSSGLL